MQGTIDELLAREWLITNGLGGFASGTVIGCPTRRYHGLLIASRRPPLERFLLLSELSGCVRSGPDTVDLSSREFNHGLEPAGHRFLREFDYCLCSPNPWVSWAYESSGVEVRRRVTMATGHPMVTIRYDLAAPGGRELALEISPVLAMRDFHHLRRESASEPWDVRTNGHWLWVQDRLHPDVTLVVFPRLGEGLAATRFAVEPAWWRNIRYRVELTRDYLGGEDLQRAGTFRCEGRGEWSVEFVAMGFAASPAEAMQVADTASPSQSVPVTRRDTRVGGDRRALAAAADQFVVRRRADGHRDQATIIAGYPWFGDWGRDSFIALEGLLLRTGRQDDARQVLQTFAGAQRNGLIPNRFDDYGGQCEYNSVDASLWYIHAADAYLSVTGDRQAWSEFLAPTCKQIVEAYVAGTDFSIGVDDRGLLCCGHPAVQITWMDAKCEDVVFTPRHGRPVEVNALWYHALRILEQRFADGDSGMALRCRSLADRVQRGFEPVFWNPQLGCLYDCVRDSEVDASIRPNQIFAVSLPHSPLSPEKQAAVLDIVTHHLLTPYGLRSLAPGDPRYKGQYGGVQMVRDEAYHNGTVWAWLIGPYVDALLRVRGGSPENRSHARQLLQPLLDHVNEAGLGSISEIFDGDAPHAPQGCIAQAWSVAEVLRVLDKVTG